MLCDAKTILERARCSHFAVGAFNVENMEMAIAVISAAEELNAPVILQTTPSTLKYAPPKIFSSIVTSLAESCKTAVALHLDHGNSVELCTEAADAGYRSVMIDASHLPFDENIKMVRLVREKIGTAIQLEAELGAVGGKEDCIEAENCYTSPQEVPDFIRQTGIDSLAVAIGTAHGFYKGVPKLDFDRLSAISDFSDVPLVLHGASGLPDYQVSRAVELGISKINFATELRVAYTRGVRDCLKEQAVYDPKSYGREGINAVRELVKEKIRICGAEGKMQLF